MQERINGLADDVRDRARERDLARRERDEALADLDDEDTLHVDCAWAKDLEAAKATITATTTERDAARAEARRLRVQRNTIMAIVAVIIVGFTIASLVAWG
jgi:t-SNARE complex subunit (syntaxin)